MRVDLHTHSTASDGTDAPADLPRLAKAAGLDGFALTDHDTVAGLAAAAAAAKKAGLRFVAGVELSAQPDPFANPITPASEPDQDASGSMHILGYHLQHDHPTLSTFLANLQDARATRNPQIIEKLQNLGVRITYDDVLNAANSDAQIDDDKALSVPASTIGRPHIAQVLVQRGYVKSIHQAFAQYLGQGAAAYTPRQLPTAAAAIQAIHDAGGAAVLAHPALLALSPADLEHRVAKLADLGLDGIETQHSDHEPQHTKQLKQLAERFDLIPTGGSDYHGSRKAIALGSVLAPQDAMHRLEEAAAQYA